MILLANRWQSIGVLLNLLRPVLLVVILVARGVCVDLERQVEKPIIVII
jgi:hypothetical protein